MSSVNYFHSRYRKEEPRTDARFGIADDGVLAYTTLSEDESLAYVTNHNCRTVSFTPVDHNIVVMSNGNECSQCDGMLYVPSTHELIFVELKDRVKDWISEAVEQLESTIRHFSANHDIADFPRRSAYAANRQRPYYHVSKKEECEAFRRRTGFRLNISNEIVIK